MPNIPDIDEMIVYAERYAITRGSYANGSMAALVEKYAPALTAKTRGVLVRDITEALKDKTIPYEGQRREWKTALKKLDEFTEIARMNMPQNSNQPIEPSMSKLKKEVI